LKTVRPLPPGRALPGGEGRATKTKARERSPSREPAGLSECVRVTAERSEGSPKGLARARKRAIPAGVLTPYDVPRAAKETDHGGPRARLAV
jgi:hypothetical protein